VCDAGGVLNRVTHFYSYDSLAQRAAVRQTLAGDAEWQRDYIDQARPYVAHQARPRARKPAAAPRRSRLRLRCGAQESTIMLEASDCHAAAGVPPASHFQARLPRASRAPHAAPAG
jgi:hypothetical protein